MKLYITLFLVFFSSLIFCQNENEIYRVFIQIDTDINGELKQNYILIDSAGFISGKENKIQKKLNLKSFSREIQSLISGEKLKKTPPKNDESEMYVMPKRNMKTVHVYIVLKADFKKDKDYLYKSTYELTEEDIEINDTNYNFLKYFEKTNRDLIKQSLE